MSQTTVSFQTCLSYLDLAILTETGDVDGDGKISLSDFRKMLNFSKPQDDDQPETAES